MELFALIQHNFVDTLRLIIASSFSRQPYLDSERFFLTFSLLGTIIFLGAFQGSLINIFSESRRYPDIDTLEKLSKTDYQIYTTFEDLKFDVFGNDTTNPITQKLQKMVKLAGKNEEVRDIDRNIVNKRNIGGLIRRATMLLTNKTR